MPRVKGGPRTRRRHKAVLKLTKGQYGGKHRLWRRGHEAMMKSLWYTYRDRRNRKRDFRRLWITRITAACRARGISYSQFMFGLQRSCVALNRKMLSELAIADEAAFDKAVALARA